MPKSPPSPPSSPSPNQRPRPPQPPDHPAWTPTPIRSPWDDLLADVPSPEAWVAKRTAVAQRFEALLRNDAAPPVPADMKLRIERSWTVHDAGAAGGGFRIDDVSYQVEADERAHAYIATPLDAAPAGGRPAVVCLHGTTNWGARQSLGLGPEAGDPHAEGRTVSGKDFARQLVRRGFVTISPEHFCAARRVPEEGPYETAAFYRRHPDWSAVGKYVHDSKIALTVLSQQPHVDAARIGVTGHSLGGQGSIWLAAADERVACSAPSCAAHTFRENPQPLHWSRDYWYIYFPQLREQFLRGEQIACDFHEQMALIAPRPLFDRFALNDGPPETQAQRTLLHLKLRELYRLLGAEEAHAYLTFGDGHSIPTLSSSAMVEWLERWLKHDGDPLGGWDAALTPDTPGA